MNIIYHNIIGFLAIILGFYLLLNQYRFLTIIVGAVGLAVVLYGMKCNMPKALPLKAPKKRKKK
jgi:hypothetical protein